MPDLEISYDPAIWAALAEAPGAPDVPEAVATLARLRLGGPGTGRFLLLADPMEPPVVADVSAVAVAAASPRAAAAEAFPEASAEQLEDVELADGGTACRYVRFPQASEFLPGEPGEEVFVAKLHYVRVLPGVDPVCVLIATVITPRINDLAGIAEQVESLVELATVG